MGYESESKNNCSWCLWNILNRLVEGSEGIENQWKNLDYLKYGIVESQNIQKSPADPRRLVIT